MAADRQCSLSMSILSSLIGLVIGMFIFVLLNIFIKIVGCGTKRQHGLNANLGLEHESHMLGTTLYPFSNFTRRPTFITFETLPGHALSDLDRDIKLDNVDCQDVRDLEAQYLGCAGNSDVITHGHHAIFSSENLIH